MITNKKYITSYDAYVNFAKIKKNESLMKISSTRDELVLLNKKLGDVMQNIAYHEAKVRRFGQDIGEIIRVSEYELMRINIHHLLEDAEKIRSDEKIMRSVYDSQLEELGKILKILEKVLEKQSESRYAIDESIFKKASKEIDDLWGQMNWIKTND